MTWSSSIALGLAPGVGEARSEASSSTGESSARRRARPPRPEDARAAAWPAGRSPGPRRSCGPRPRRIPCRWSASATNSSVKSLARWVRMYGGILSRRAPGGEVVTVRRYRGIARGASVPRDRAEVRWLNRPGRSWRRRQPTPPSPPLRAAAGRDIELLDPLALARRAADVALVGSAQDELLEGRGRRPCRRIRRWASGVRAGRSEKGSAPPLLPPPPLLPGGRGHVPAQPVGLPVVEPDGVAQHLERRAPAPAARAPAPSCARAPCSPRRSACSSRIRCAGISEMSEYVGVLRVVGGTAMSLSSSPLSSRIRITPMTLACMMASGTMCSWQYTRMSSGSPSSQ